MTPVSSPPMFIEPRDVDYANFPASTLTSENMQVLTADLQPEHGTAILGVEYARKDGIPLHLQILLPPMDRESTAIFPLVVFVQGSAWFEQNLGQSLPPLAHFARKGFVVAIVEYRPSPVATFPAQIRDTGTAIRFLRRNSSDYHVDPTRIVLWGDSSGGHTTVLTCLTEGDPFFSDEPLGQEPLNIRCFIDYYGPTDISRMNEEPSTQNHIEPASPEGMLIGGLNVLKHPDLVAPTVAMNHVSSTPRRRPLLIVHGDKDRLVPFGQSVLLHDALRSAGQPVTFYQLKGADHGGPAFWKEEILSLVENFIRANI
ncbi:alpha/beta hydrolase fold domain-containing protein [Paenarthrobacter histidinolovorans]|uniref:Acetyl esterase/lipase n=1 Tax=Paenarthrobacter histidinolovorans TaxID=43664 RepID=A0ABW8N790_9MICC